MNRSSEKTKQGNNPWTNKGEHLSSINLSVNFRVMAKASDKLCCGSFLHTYLPGAVLRTLSICISVIHCGQKQSEEVSRSPWISKRKRFKCNWPDFPPWGLDKGRKGFYSFWFSRPLEWGGGRMNERLISTAGWGGHWYKMFNWTPKEKLEAPPT